MSVDSDVPEVLLVCSQASAHRFIKVLERQFGDITLYPERHLNSIRTSFEKDSRADQAITILDTIIKSSDHQLRYIALIMKLRETIAIALKENKNQEFFKEEQGKKLKLILEALEDRLKDALPKREN